jgi:sigma-B regulation protein RsbU (phosphoserine phosphatase)
MAASPRSITAPRMRTSCDFIQTLMKLQRAAQLITSTLDLDTLLDRVVNDLAESLGGVEVAVWLRDDESDEMVLRGARGCTLHKKGARLKIGVEGMVGHVAASGKMRYAPDVDRDPYYIACEPGTRSAVTIPLRVSDAVIGVLCVDHGETGAFSNDQLQVMQALAGHIAVAIENARLFEQERMQRERLRHEAEEARVIQQALFPKAFPLVPGFAFEAAWCPAGVVAGDWFDFIDLGEDRHGIVLADVSGKGMPAALLMAATRAVFRTIAKLYSSPGEALAHVNRTLLEDFPLGKFVTMIYCVLDAGTRTLTVASAGHPWPLLINGDCSFVAVDPGLPLGLGLSSYPEHRIPLERGAGLLLYTDGITESMNRQYEEYGPTRLMGHFLQADAGVDGLIEEVRRFGHGSELIDDATAVLIRSR